MRRVWIALPLLFACAKAETPPPAPPAGPVALTDADLAGTWTGTAMPMGSDSVIMRFTQICGAGMCKGVMEGAKDTLPATYTLSADSAYGQSTAPYADPMNKGQMVVDHWVFRMVGGKATGTGMVTLASKPDSTVLRYHFEGSRMP